MSQTLVEKAGEHIAQSVREASCMTAAITEAVADGVEAARRVARQGGDVAEDFMKDSTRRVQRNPLVAVVATLVVGLGVGVLAGLSMKRK